MIPTRSLAPFLPIAFAACIDLAQAPPAKERYLLSARRSSVTAAPAGAPVLMLRTFAVAPAYSSRAFVVRTGGATYESDHYHEFFVTPADAVTAIAERWLGECGLFGGVVRPGSPLAASWRLEVDVRQLCFDLAEPAQPRTVVELWAYLVREEAEGGKVQLSRGFSATVSARSVAAADLVRALDAAVAKCLESLETALAEALRA